MLDPRRRLAAPPFPDDRGAADPALAEALAARRPAGCLHALQSARLLVPVVAVLGEVERDSAGRARDTSSDMAAVLVERPDGRRGLLAFSSLTSMQAWDADARPVPVPARTAALAAIQDGATALVLDVAGPASFVVEGDHLRALAAGWRLVRVGADLGWVGTGDPEDGSDDGSPDADWPPGEHLA